MDGREPLAGRYELRGLLGAGGMAEVHDGWDLRLNRAVAIKLLYPSASADAEARRRFEAEARAAASLNHPNIVAVHDFGEHDGSPFIVMERLPGRTLGDEIAMGPMAQHRVRAMLDDVLGALGAAHAAGVLHRDIKPGNVLFAQNGSAMKVADFGIAKTAASALTTTGQILGTMAYMSPQRVAGAPASVVDDLYAVGVMAHEALSGRRPFPQENPMSLMRAILDDPPPPIEAVRSDVDPNLATVINRAMSRDERTIFPSAVEMRSALAGVVAPSRPPTKVLAQPIGPSTSYLVAPRPARRPMTRRRKLVLAAAALVGLLVATFALALDPSSSTQPLEPVSSSTAAPPPPPPPPSSSAPSPTPVPVVDEPQHPPKKKPGGNGRGNGNKKP
jgi:eukaryotic-like serine/threonine-protein kinase